MQFANKVHLASDQISIDLSFEVCGQVYEVQIKPPNRKRLKSLVGSRGLSLKDFVNWN
jgi:uncharacterized Zn finger protein